MSAFVYELLSNDAFCRVGFRGSFFMTLGNRPNEPSMEEILASIRRIITEDENGMDQKVIALPISKIDRENDDIKDIDDVNKNTLSIIKDFFTNYKNNEPNKWVKCGDYENKEKTITFIQEKTLS